MVLVMDSGRLDDPGTTGAMLENAENGPLRRLRRMMMIGIDSTSRSFVERNSNRLPILSRILNEGRARDLHSSAEFASASVWPTFVSGEDPGHHGHYFPLQFDPEEMRYRNMHRGQWARRFDIVPFWYSFARRGVKTIVLDAGSVNPAKDVPGIEVVNWNYQSTSNAFSTPPEVLSELRKRFGTRPIGPEIPVHKSARHARQLRDSMIESVRLKADAIIWLSQNYEWDFFLAGLYEVHRAGHNLWPSSRDFASLAAADDMLDVYIATDQQIGRIIETLDLSDTQFVAFSLSGMESNAGQEHLVPEMLRRLNLQYLSGEKVETPVVRHRNLMSLLRAAVPPRLQYATAAFLGELVQDWVVNRALLGNMNWKETPSFYVHAGGEGLVRYNLKGRERDGYFDPESPEFEHYSTWLKQRLLEIKVSATGEPLIAAIDDVQQNYPGERSLYLPDLRIHWAPEESVDTIESDAIGTIHRRLATGRGGNHNGESFAAFLGRGADEDSASAVASITDLSAHAVKWFDQENADRAA